MVTTITTITIALTELFTHHTDKAEEVLTQQIRTIPLETIQLTELTPLTEPILLIDLALAEHLFLQTQEPIILTVVDLPQQPEEEVVLTKIISHNTTVLIPEVKTTVLREATAAHHLPIQEDHTEEAAEVAEATDHQGEAEDK